MKLTKRVSAAALALVMGAGMFALPTAARASEEGRRNTALALGAAAAGLLLTQKNKVPGIVAAAGAAYAYKRYQDRVNDRHRYERDWGYNDRYDRYDSRYDRDYRYDSDYRYDRYDRDDRYYSGNRYDRNYDRNYDRRYRDGQYDRRNDRDCDDFNRSRRR